MSYKIELENFEGPMDLLLYFIRRDELDIYDIPISHITKEFMIVLNKWDELNMIIAGDFIVMASTLMRIKVKMMLPRKEIDDLGEIIDPRSELIHQLIEYKRFRDAAETLNQLAKKRSLSFTRSIIYNGSSDEEILKNIFSNEITLYDLAKVFKEAMDNKPVITEFELIKEPIKLEEQKIRIIAFFDGDGRLSFENLIKKLNTRYEIILTFLAILDLIKNNICTFQQTDTFGDIELNLLNN